MQKQDTLVFVIYHEASIMAGCKRCRKIHASGNYTVGVEIEGEKYLVGADPPVMCCGEEKKIPLLFSTKEEAEQVRDEVIVKLAKTETTACLHLLSLVFVPSNPQ